MKINKTIGYSVATAILGTTVIGTSVGFFNPNKEKILYSKNGLTISTDGNEYYVTQLMEDGTYLKRLLKDINHDNKYDSADLGMDIDIKISSNNLTEDKETYYISVKQLIDLINSRGKEKVDYSSFKNLTNHLFDAVKVEEYRRLEDPEDKDHPLYYSCKYYYNDQVIYSEEHQYVALDKDGNKVFLEYISSKESLDDQGIDVTTAEEYTNKEELNIPTYSK